MDERLNGMPLVGALRTQLPTAQRIGEKQINKAAEILRKYKDGKTALENRVVEDEMWYEMRHWETLRRDMRGRGKYTGPEPSSGWLFNAILNKHADMMDNIPEPVVLPRESSDRDSAAQLSDVLPVVMEYNNFEKTYADASWEKLKHGTAVYGVFWDPKADNGLGDIDIHSVDILKVFWEPGIENLQDSHHLFLTELADIKDLEQQYPEYKGKLNAKTVDVRQYIYSDTVDTSDKAVVVDWYYKVEQNGVTVLHYAKFCGNCLLYASENDPRYAERGWYDHGMYPIVFDTLFPEKGTPAGFGYVSVCKDPQLYIDKLSANILESSLMATKKRYLVSESTNINLDEFKDWAGAPLVHVAGSLDGARLQEIRVDPLSGVYLDVLNQKIEEMKDTAGNRDVNSGGTGSSVTAAAAIAALQEAGNKTSRDLIAASYRAHVEISKLCIELMRQFYDEKRSFRITGRTPGQFEFVEFSNAKLQPQPLRADSFGEMLYRKPVFDLKIKAQKKNPFSRMEQNQRAAELYQMGFFDPNRAQEAAGALEMMDFEGVEEVREYVGQGATLLSMVQQMSAQMDKMAAIIQMSTGMDMGLGQQPSPVPQSTRQTGGETVADRMQRETMRANAPMTDYGTRLAQRSGPDMDTGGGG